MNSFALNDRITLRIVWSDYQQARHLKPVTVRNYNQRLNAHLSDWLDLDIRELNKWMVEERHKQITGQAMANATMRTLRALISFARIKYELPNGEPLLKANPVQRLNELRQWHRERPRRTIIHPEQLPSFFEGVNALENSTMRDLILFATFSGCRKNEALNLTWNDIDFDSRVITFRNTKMSGDDYLIPMSTALWRLLALRKLTAVSAKYVFPGRAANKPFTAAWASFAQARKVSGINFSLHWLRRSFVTYADALGIKSEVVRALINHGQSGNLTESYTVRSFDQLHAATEAIGAFIKHQGQLHPSQWLVNESSPSCDSRL